MRESTGPRGRRARQAALRGRLEAARTAVVTLQAERAQGEQAPAPAAAAPAAPPAPSPAPGHDRDAVAACGSGSNWSIDTGDGHHGGLQFSQPTWAGSGGTAYAPHADPASREQQIAVGERVLAAQGKGAWPTCGRGL